MVGEDVQCVAGCVLVLTAHGAGEYTSLPHIDTGDIQMAKKIENFIDGIHSWECELEDQMVEFSDSQDCLNSVLSEIKDHSKAMFAKRAPLSVVKEEAVDIVNLSRDYARLVRIRNKEAQRIDRILARAEKVLGIS